MIIRSEVIVLKRNTLWQKLLFLAIYAVIVGAFWYFQIPCVFKKFLGFPCPGCGMSHAVLAVLRLDFAEAFRCHAMFWSLPLLLGYYFTDGHLFLGEKWNRIIFCVIAIGFLLNWLCGIFC